ISRGRLTTGVAVPAWTAVFMLHGSFSTAAASYMQTIFRAQSPAVINGKVKEECFVFDFAPDRTLKVLAETAKVSAKAGKAKANDKKILGEFLNFCPVISFHGAQMAAINVDHMMQQLKRVYVDRVVRNGFEDVYLYNDRLMQLDHLELEKFARLRDIIGQTKAMKRTDEVDINNQGFTNEEYEEIETIKKKKKEARTVEDLEKLKEMEEKKKQRHTAISILRGISIRMPMILYGATITNEKTEITLDNFTELVDDQSWEEFMPKGVTKELFKEFIPYYDEDIFAASGIRIRNLAREADEMDIEERIERITTIFTSFRNPDKETVLTPWRVVNMQLADTLGGWCFYDEDYKERLLAPRYVNQGDVTRDTLTENSRVLEINSKSGLYPLYVAYSIYRSIIDKEQMSYMITDAAITSRVAHHHQVWDKVLRDNLFVICKTPMAKSITYRTLAGFREGVKVNAHYLEDLINQISNKKDKFVKKVTSGSYWNKKDIAMLKFNAVVGNPPYQVTDGSGAAGDSAMPIYHKFVNIAKELMPNYISIIMPSKWMIGGRGLQDFRAAMAKDKRIEKIFDYENDREIFTTTHIDSGLCYFLWNKDYSGQVEYAYKPTEGHVFIQKRDLQNSTSSFIVRDFRRQGLIHKVTQSNSFSEIVSARKPFGINTDLF
ncbi:MAG: Eco57I restriction-modification methylase domain-containing protein, partial [Bacteroidales bacterium]|nr:Eco57I restriction-modification methylase domain-containing protein [Candidatus Colicola coprequi]